MSYQKHNFEAGAVLLASQLNEMDNEIEILSQGGGGGGGSSFTEEFKVALLNCFGNVAWSNQYGQTYYDALYNSLFGGVTLESIYALFTQGSAIIYDTDSLNTLRQYLVVTATYSDESTAIITEYTLSGTLTVGTSVITVNYGGKTTTFNVTVTSSQGMYTITNNLTGCITSNSATSIMENTSYNATITPIEGYSIDDAVVNITMGGTNVTGAYSGGTISIPNVTGNLVITVTAVEKVVSSIVAIFNQGDNKIYPSDSLDVLRQYLVVTATYNDNTTSTVSSYTLSGTLIVGTSIITASYGGKTTTFNVTVSVEPVVPDTYQQVEYIEGSSTVAQGPYFNTGYYPTMTGNLILEVDCMPTSLSANNSAPIGVTQVDTTGNIGVAIFFPNGEPTKVNVYNGEAISITVDTTTALNKRFSLVGTFNASGYESITDGTNSNSQTTADSRAYGGTSRPVSLFGIKKSNVSQVSYPFKGRIYHAKITENNVVQRDLYPCYRKSDNTPGFYDSINNTFITKAGSGEGAITVGPDVME